MKIKILTAIASKLLGEKESISGVRADMFLPVWILGFGTILLCGAVGSFAVAFIVKKYTIIVASVILLFLGILAILCWKNQTIRILDEERFEYTTFLGNKRVYYFSDIIGIRRNKDSMTLFVGDGKVHIENNALITKRLSAKLNEMLSPEE